MKKIIGLAIFSIGFTALSMQIVLLRELIGIFYGNELSIGLILGIWLILGSLGTGFFARRINFKKPEEDFAILQVLLGFSFLIGFVLTYAIRFFTKITPGQICNLNILIVYTIFTLLGLCLVNGILFVLAIKIFTDDTKNNTKGIARVYMLESFGAAAGGLIVSFFLIPKFCSLEIVLILVLINFIFALLIFTQKKRIFLGLVNLICIFSCLFLFRYQAKINNLLLNLRWQKEQVLTSQNSVYANITLTQTKDQYNFFYSGLFSYSWPDSLTEEGTTHFALLEHSHPKEILLIGTGPGSIQEVLKYKPQMIDYVELDPLLITLAQKYLPLHEIFKDEHLNLKFLDGYLFVKNTNSKYDVIIMAVSHPFTIELNRFYTKEFFKNIKKILKKDGVFSFGVISSESYIGPELQKYLSCISNTLKSVFEDVIFIPGDQGYFIVSNQKNILTYDYSILLNRLQERNIKTLFVREYYLKDKLNKEKINYSLNRFKENIKNTALNYNFYPRAYWYDLIFWLNQTQNRLAKILNIISPFLIWIIFILYLILVFIFLNNRYKASLLAIGTTGFSVICFQMLVIFCFQVIYGYLFYKLGIILACFMCGLGLGALILAKKECFLENYEKSFIFTQIFLIIFPLIIILASFLIKIKNQFILNLGANFIYPLISLIAGLMAGLEYPLINKIYLEKKHSITDSAGLTYAMDLAGASLGSIFCIIILPVLGLYQVALFLILLNLITLINFYLKKDKI